MKWSLQEIDRLIIVFLTGVATFVCCLRGSHLGGCGRRGRGPHLQTQPRQALRDPRLQTAHWHPCNVPLCHLLQTKSSLSKPCWSSDSEWVSLTRCDFFFHQYCCRTGNWGLPRRHGLQIGRNKQRHHCVTGNRVQLQISWAWWNCNIEKISNPLFELYNICG